jgi:hypothetical protein
VHYILPCSVNGMIRDRRKTSQRRAWAISCSPPVLHGVRPTPTPCRDAGHRKCPPGRGEKRRCRVISGPPEVRRNSVIPGRGRRLFSGRVKRGRKGPQTLKPSTQAFEWSAKAGVRGLRVRPFGLSWNDALCCNLQLRWLFLLGHTYPWHAGPRRAGRGSTAYRVGIASSWGRPDA